MPPARKATSKRAKQVEQYKHDDATRLNNPEAGLARYETEAPPKKRFEYKYDARMDPQLEWAGKAERTSFDVDAVSIHVHERLSTEAIIATVRKEPPQLAMFNDPQLERDKEISFYQHDVDWTNRLILGDSLVVMTSLLERERMGGQVQCIYFDPPYGINYNSNFQADITNRSPRETDDGALTREPEQIQAYRDTWTLGVHSYLTYLRDRLLVARELLAEEGSIFVQIGPENAHRVRLLLDEVFGADNACTMIVATTTSGLGASLLPDVHTHLLWYAKSGEKVKYRQLTFRLFAAPDATAVQDTDRGAVARRAPRRRRRRLASPCARRVPTGGDNRRRCVPDRQARSGAHCEVARELCGVRLGARAAHRA